MAVLRKHCRLIIAQMAQTIGRKAVASHRCDQSGNFPRAAAHQRALERRKTHAVQHACRNADDIFGRRADFVADQIRSIIEADQPTGEPCDQPFFDRFAARINDHAVWNPVYKLLHVTRPKPDGYVVAIANGLFRNFRKAAQRRYLYALHAQRKRFSAHVLGGNLRHQIRQILRANGNADQFAFKRLAQIRRNAYIVFQRHQTIGARPAKLLDVP